MKKIFLKIKNLLLTSFLVAFVTFNSIGQTIEYTDLNGDRPPRGTFEKYVSKNGESYSVGDTIIIGVPSGTNGKFVYIQKVDLAGTVYVVGSEATNTNAELKKIRVSGTKRSGWKVSFQTKGFTGVDNYFFKIEDAIASGEVKSKGMTSDEALSELKKAKDKLDLELITPKEYEKIKKELSKYIK